MKWRLQDPRILRQGHRIGEEQRLSGDSNSGGRVVGSKDRDSADIMMQMFSPLGRPH